MSNLNNDDNKEKKNSPDDKSSNEIRIYIDPLRILFTFIFGWVLLPLLIKKLTSSELSTVYILWFYTYFNIKLVLFWIICLLQSFLFAIKSLKFFKIDKIVNFIYVLLNTALQILLFLGLIRYIYFNQITSLLAILLVFVQPICSEIGVFIGKVLFPHKSDEDYLE